MNNRIARHRALAGLLLCGMLGMGAAQAQQCIVLSNVDVPATQDFDALSNVAGSTTNTLALPGWSMVESGGSARDNDQYAVDTGGSSTGDTYSYGTAGAGDRALGSLRSGTLAATWGACYTNNTGAAIQALDIAYTGEQWRLGTAARADRLDFQYSLDATSLATGAWTDVDALDFATPNTATTGAKDGNAAENRGALSANIPALSIPSGATFWIRWNDADASGADDGLAIDALSLTARGQGGGGTPTLSIADTQAVEGDSGTTQLMFTVSLGAAATSAVTVDYATADGTATAGSDYVATSGTLAIPAGSTSVTFGVVVNGDTATEPNETFFVDLSNPTNATIADAQAVGTIANDDVVLTPIHAIQGSGNLSPVVGQQVSTRGIVTGRKSNGFFLQTADADADADPATSQGVFVFTGAAPPADAQSGNALIVSGTVVEYVPAADPGQLSLTEITGPAITLASVGNALPTPVQLTTSFPSPTGPLDQLERVEGMRVTAASFTVVAATAGNTSEPNATGSSNGQLNLVVTGTPRPFREPGIQAPDPAPGGGSIPPIPRWDFNPELLFSDTDALGGPRYDLAAGATLTQYVGPLDYGFRRFSIHQDPTVAPTITQGPAPSAARLPTAEEFTYAVYNLERFFDTVNDGNGAPTLTATAFANRVNKASLGIRDYLHTPDILGVMETENLSALQAIADKVNGDAVAAGQPSPQYVAYLVEGNDVGGIDVGFLVKTAQVAAATPRVEVVQVQQVGKDTTWTEPSGTVSLLNDRPPLRMDAIVHFADGRAFPLTAIQVHQRSLNGADTDDADGTRVRAKRQRQAEFLASYIDGLQDADPARRIAVGGDFNAFEFNDGLVDTLGVTTGMPSADNQTAVAGDGVDLLDQDLLNLTLEAPASQRYSFEFDGNVQSIDHILVNQALGAAAGAVDVDHPRINVDFPEIARSNANSASRLADHDPVVAYFSVGSADLSIVASASPATVAPGAAMTFNATVSNAGPGAATFPGAGFAFDAELPGLAVTPPSGWTCDTPTIAAGTTQVACSASVIGSGAFQLVANAPLAEAGNTIVMSASVDSQTYDPNPANNNATASVAVGGGGLGLAVTGPATIPSSQGYVDYAYQLSNNATTAAGAPRLVITGNTVAITSAVSPPAGWQCQKRKTAGTRTWTITCTAASLAAGASVTFGLNVDAKPTPAGNTITVNGAATSNLVGDEPSDNSASFSTQVQ